MSLILGIIPARYASVRFPGKVLAELNGKPVIQHVYERVQQARDIDKVLIAVDHEKVKAAAEAFGATVIMTSQEHPSGTDRCREALDKSGLTADFVVNIQGDEPMIEPSLINALTSRLHEKPQTEIATVANPLRSPDELFSPNVVKVLIAKTGEALYFSRQAIPFMRDFPKEEWLLKKDLYYKHVGLYAYRTDILRTVSRLPPSRLEQCEALEQLRWMDSGYSVQVVVSPYGSRGVDTPEDLDLLRREAEKKTDQKD